MYDLLAKSEDNAQAGARAALRVKEDAKGHIQVAGGSLVRPGSFRKSFIHCTLKNFQHLFFIPFPHVRVSR